jgi:hypothetical protein
VENSVSDYIALIIIIFENPPQQSPFTKLKVKTAESTLSAFHFLNFSLVRKL